ncbi:phage shock protein E [Seminavis robusta]|uniref:Phage shock protein E n=1 Tax=Seminavis robusta TaxID=568900 RepID=A0A9N8H549_9STRA|nr:phage shock protein E [Seminavis robusta]|eukprot:Sro103_g052550.1 phage shock protein E (132) ;mRNA; f:77458-77853
MKEDYFERAKNYGFAPQLDILAALSRSDTVVLDVRREEEIAETGKVQGNGQWKSTGCTPSACPKLAADPTQFVQDKETPVVIYCRSGRRAVKAQEILEQSGFTKVMNAGGYDDLMDMLNWQQRDNNQNARS